MIKEKEFKYPVFVPKDIDGFFGLFIDNLANMIFIIGVCKFVLHFPDELVFGRIFPGIALSILFGNWYYFEQARKLAKKEQRTDVTALPYGINTPTVFAYLFLIMLPVYIKTGSVEITWYAGLAACFLSGVIEISGAWIGPLIRKITPRAALLTTLGGVAITFIAMTPTIRLFVHPTIGLITISIILVGYFTKAKIPFGIPAGFLAVLVGTVLAWCFGLQDAAALKESFHPAFNKPVLSFKEVIEGLGLCMPYLSIIIPLAVMNFFGTMQCLESAAAAGDSYPTRSTMVVDGIGTTIGSLFGSCFPTTVYIGHPGWKSVGARCGYSLLNGTVITIIVLFGLMKFFHYLIPEDAAGAILLYIGLIMMTQAYSVTPREHFPAVSIGFIPHMAAWLMTVIAGTLAAFSIQITPETIDKLASGNIYITGISTLGGGSLLTSMIWVAILIEAIEHKFNKSAYWTIPAIILSYFGFIHADKLSYTWYTPNAQAALGYLIMGAFFLILHETNKGDSQKKEAEA